MKSYLFIFISSILCCSHAYSQDNYLNTTDVSNIEDSLISATSIQDMLTDIGQSHGYFAFYKSGPTEFLGNFADCANGLYYRDFHFKNSEAAFQWAKFRLAAEHHQNSEMLSDLEMELFFEADGEEAFQLRNRLAQKYKGVLPIDWSNGLRDQVMWQILQAKFQQNPDFAEYLLITQPLYLLEHNEKEGRDIYWSDDFSGKGFNMLGKMLMAIRDDQPCPPPFEDTDLLERLHYAEDFNNKKPYNIY